MSAQRWFARLARSQACAGLCARATAARVFVQPGIAFVGAVAAVPVDAIKEADNLIVDFVSNSAAFRVAAATLAEDKADGGLTRHGGVGTLQPLLESLVARRAVGYFARRSGVSDEWLWQAARAEFEETRRTPWSPLAASVWSCEPGVTYNPNLYALVAASQLGIQCTAHAQPLSAKQWQLQPVAGNALLGADLPANKACALNQRVGSYISMRGHMLHHGKDSRIIRHLRALRTVPGYVALTSGVGEHCDVALGDMVWLRFDNASRDDAARLHGRVARVAAITAAGALVDVLPRAIASCCLLAEAEAAVAAPGDAAMLVPYSRCHLLYQSADGHLLRHDELDRDAARLYIPVDTTRTEAAITRSVAAAREAAPALLVQALGDAARRALECDKDAFKDRDNVFVADVTAAQLFRRARSLARKPDNLWRLTSRYPFSFCDMHCVPLSPPVHDFVWRLLHGRLAFEGYLKMASGALMTHCPDCSVLRSSLDNDHPTRDCVSAHRNVVAIAGVLDTWLTPEMVLLHRGAADAFARAWRWELLPSRRAGFTIPTILLVAITKHLLWISFTARVFASASVDMADVVQHHRVSGFALANLSDDDLIASVKREFRASLRFVERHHVKLFRCMARFVRHVL